MAGGAEARWLRKVVVCNSWVLPTGNPDVTLKLGKNVPIGFYNISLRRILESVNPNDTEGHSFGEKIGYARVSTLDQNLEIQETRLQEAGCTIIRAEKISGKSRGGRSELAVILEFIRPGDELIVVRLDRLARSTRDVLNVVHELEQKGAGLRVLEPQFCTSGDNGSGRIMATVLGMVAEMERKFILERQRAGIDAAKSRGVYKGRKPSVPVEEVRRLRGEGKGPAEIAEALGVSRMSAWRALNA